MRWGATRIPALFASWICYFLVALPLADQEAGRCHDLGEQARACFSPFLWRFLLISFVFLGATVVLAFGTTRISRSDRT